MTSEKRLALFREAARKHTKANASSRAAAKNALVREGIYDANGSLSSHYGGDKPAVMGRQKP